jgi:hypothetical protein
VNVNLYCKFRSAAEALARFIQLIQGITDSHPALNPLVSDGAHLEAQISEALLAASPPDVFNLGLLSCEIKVYSCKVADVIALTASMNPESASSAMDAMCWSFGVMKVGSDLFTLCTNALAQQATKERKLLGQ